MESAYLNALPSAIVAVDYQLSVQYVNPAAEDLFSTGASHAVGKPLSMLPGFDGELCSLCERAFDSGEEISLFERELVMMGYSSVVNLHVTPVMELKQILITIEKPDGLNRLNTSQWKQETTRAAGVMAAMLAHEVKNPLSGIRGAAQLLREDVGPEQQPLAELICMETDRIADLLTQVEIFSDVPPEEMQPVNIHEVLQYVITIARSGFAPHVEFKEVYDPSLPPVLGKRDLLVQLFLNLVKNAAEAISQQKDATIKLSTQYRSGSRLKLGAAEGRALPMAVTIEDNGPGIPEEVRLHLFEPFVSSKEKGRGLGLAIVAKIASDLGAVVELDREFAPGTRFTVLLASA